MINLPFLNPENELSLNVGRLLIILHELAVTKRDKRILTLDKALTFYFLSLNPVILNRVLGFAGKPEFYMDELEYYTVDSIYPNVELFFGREKIKGLMQLLAAKKLLDVTYDSKDGFLFGLSGAGMERAELLSDNYFSIIRKYIDKMRVLQSASIGQLNGYINSALHAGVKYGQ